MGKGVDLIYKLDDINADDGINVFEIVPVLMHFGELIKSANNILGYERKIDIRIKPFREGSWITEFVLQNSSSANLLNYLKANDGKDLMLLLSFLGLNVATGIQGVASIIRFTKGCVSKFNKNGETVTYINEEGEELPVSLAEHKLVQSPLIQNYYYNSIIMPLDKFPNATAVTVKVNKEGHQEQKFTSADRPAFEQYAKAELLEGIEENISLMSGVFVKPKRGSYSGTEQAYSFIVNDNNVLWPVTIEDDVFLNKLQAGDIRLYSEDILKVDLEIRQKKDSANKLMGQYAITKVIEYIKFEKPKQINIEDIKDKRD